jgi:hypothetical protein
VAVDSRLKMRFLHLGSRRVIKSAHFSLWAVFETPQLLKVIDMQELEDMLAHLVSDAYVRQCLSEWANYVVPSSFVLNPHARSGNLRERFLARLYEHHDELTGTCQCRFIGSCNVVFGFLPNNS